MSRDELTREELLAQMLASSEALAAEWKAQDEANRVDLEVARMKNAQIIEALAQAEKRALVHNNSKLDEQKARDAAEARVRELEASVGAYEAAEQRMTRELGDYASGLAAANALLARIGVWADTYGAALVPHGGAADSFGDGVRYCKRQVKQLLSAQPAARECSYVGRCNSSRCPKHGGAPENAQADSGHAPDDCSQRTTDHDRAVLEAGAAIPEEDLREAIAMGIDYGPGVTWARAELARREAKRGW